MWYTYWWMFSNESSNLYGEEFFTELRDSDVISHLKYIKELFPNERIMCLGLVTAEEAEEMGLDTY